MLKKNVRALFLLGLFSTSSLASEVGTYLSAMKTLKDVQAVVATKNYMSIVKSDLMNSASDSNSDGVLDVSPGVNLIDPALNISNLPDLVSIENDGFDQPIGMCVKPVSGTPPQDNEIVFSIVSSLNNKVFDTSCSNLLNGIVDGDDISLSVTYGELINSVGGISFFKEPVETISDLNGLPAGGVIDGEVRLVKGDEKLYRYNATNSSWNALDSGVWNTVVLPQDGVTEGEVQTKALLRVEDNILEISDTVNNASIKLKSGEISQSTGLLSIISEQGLSQKIGSGDYALYAGSNGGSSSDALLSVLVKSNTNRVFIGGSDSDVGLSEQKGLNIVSEGIYSKQGYFTQNLSMIDTVNTLDSTIGSKGRIALISKEGSSGSARIDLTDDGRVFINGSDVLYNSSDFGLDPSSLASNSVFSNGNMILNGDLRLRSGSLSSYLGVGGEPVLNLKSRSTLKLTTGNSGLPGLVLGPNQNVYIGHDDLSIAGLSGADRLSVNGTIRSKDGFYMGESGIYNDSITGVLTIDTGGLSADSKKLFFKQNGQLVLSKDKFFNPDLSASMIIDGETYSKDGFFMPKLGIDPNSVTGDTNFLLDTGSKIHVKNTSSSALDDTGSGLFNVHGLMTSRGININSAVDGSNRLKVKYQDAVGEVYIDAINSSLLLRAPGSVSKRARILLNKTDSITMGGDILIENNLTVNGVINGSFSQMKMSKFIDSDDLSYYVDPNLDSVMRDIHIPELSGHGAGMTSVRDNIIGLLSFMASDRRVKRDIVELDSDSSLDVLRKVKSYRYYYDENSELAEGLVLPENRQIGFMAQDLLDIPELKDAVVQNKNGMYKINYFQVLPVIVDAMKEVDDKLESHEKRIVSLEEKVDKIERKIN